MKNIAMWFDRTPKHNSGGRMTLHIVHKDLTQLGLDVRIATDRYRDLPYDWKDDFVAIYPERVSGNPLGAREVVRYMLHKKDYFDVEPRVYGEKDHFIYHGPLLGPGPYLHPNILDLRLFRDDLHWKRDMVLVYRGKYKGTIDVKHDFEITNNQPVSREELAALYKKATTMYCYDTFTIAIQEAILCGCPVVLKVGTDFTIEDYLKTPLYGCGLAFDDNPESIEVARNDVSLFRQVYLRFYAKYYEQLAEFAIFLMNL